ncbi:hypothetical protein MCOR02_000826 [Pyricularia oryzae]|nr:hypothetical protein MCOR02_000826 [Pyricularia oryzae]KAI6312619.1 hypothetical protein MCOR34_005542 [Pyricularia oryzae]KAI6453898.1 hypothetical protein MCOR17_009130 [Pyricularia oryzae]KAI6497971.1 hypothetical protein MCOR11_004169 [Pyricularia oryzae]KAI6502476.1 hypothetical protein MCOR13_005324 [Pyricularia oryzae]
MPASKTHGSGKTEANGGSASQQNSGSQKVTKPPKKRRPGAWGTSKVRTGCQTCKTRHKKCDEGRPACEQCLTAGWDCDFLQQPQQQQQQYYTYPQQDPSRTQVEAETIMSPTDPFLTRDGRQLLWDHDEM